MWLFTRFGFFSVVQKPDQSFLTIRARVAADLDRLRERYMPDLSPTTKTSGTDYPYRAIISHAGFADGLRKMGENLHYPSFKDEIRKTLGVDRERVASEVWSVLHRLEAENQPPQAVPGPQFPRRLTYGAVVINCEGKILLREPYSHRGGHAWTFPKDSARPKETPEQTALRAVQEKTGVEARIIDQIPGIYTGDTTSSAYFLMMLDCENGGMRRGSKTILWATPEEAQTHIKMTTSVLSRARDLEVLEKACALYAQRYHTGCISANQVDEIETRILTCAALRFDGYAYIDRSGFDSSSALDTYLQTAELPPSPLDRMCIFFSLQRKLMKWDKDRPRASRQWKAFRQLFLETCAYCLPREYQFPEYCDRWRSEFLPKLNECMALVQVIHNTTRYEDA